MPEGEPKPQLNTFLRIRTSRDFTPKELKTTLLGIRRLYTLSYLRSQDRDKDVAKYILTNNPIYEQQAGLVIKYSSPQREPDADIPTNTILELQAPADANPNVNEALKIALESAYGKTTLDFPDTTSSRQGQ